MEEENKRHGECSVIRNLTKDGVITVYGLTCCMLNNWKLRRGFNIPSRCCLRYKDCEISADALVQCTFVKAIVDMFLNIFGVQWLCRRQSELLLIAGSDIEREKGSCCLEDIFLLAFLWLCEKEKLRYIEHKSTSTFLVLGVEFCSIWSFGVSFFFCVRC